MSATKIVRSSVNDDEKMIEKLCDSGALFGTGAECAAKSKGR